MPVRYPRLAGRHLYRSLIPALVILSGSLCGDRSALALKVLNYNILNYPAASGAVREDEFRTIVAALHPDVMVVQEVTGTPDTGMNQFLTNILNAQFPGEYAAGPWIHGSDTNNALYYRTAAFDFVSADTIGTPLRAIHHFVLRPDGYTSSAANLHLYSAHLKASSTSADQAQRLDECNRWRNRMNTLAPGTNFLGCGDFNIQSSSEASYQRLLADEADDDGRLFDPINTPGSWNNNAGFSSIHTQSPKTATNPYGGATGGMDDRFDFILASAAMLDAEGMSYVPGTYDCYGNDGMHFNLAINAPPVIPEGAAMAGALHEASDHMPVIMTIQVPARIGVVASLNFGTVIIGATANQMLAVNNVAVAPADELTYTFVAPVGFTSPGGTQNVNAGLGQNHTIGMLTATIGNKNGNLSISTDDVDNPTKLVALSGTVVRHAVPSVVMTPVATLDTLDFGSHPVGMFTDGAVQVHNSGYDALQAQLDVYGASFTGPDAARFSIVGGFTPALVAGTPAGWTIHFDDTGAADNTTYTADLTFTTRDESLPGQTNLSNVVWRLTAHTQATSGVPGDGTRPTISRLVGNYPNPFTPATRLAFEIGETGLATIGIFDVHGRLVRRLVEAPFAPGVYEQTWDGTDDHGREVSQGVYFYRLATATRRETKTMTLVR
ncbi:MAG: choice-of-anchor D domain-containing protein [Candidatus Eisenbacteria bacterium]|nr:choice-of-anchor D domain-containing protein [Candidatus Eisenbacteria bacterium]